MSHELRTPLNSIIGFSDVLRNADKNQQIRENVVEYATDIQTSGTHLLDLINEILDMSKIEAGMFEIEDETVSLQETVDTCVRLLSQRAETGSIDLENRLPADLPPIRGDRKAMRQILLNLLSNAVKFTEPGGRVTIDGDGDGQGICITVTDTGLGLPITKALVELHGGNLILDSAVGVGTTVKVLIPKSRIMG